MKLCASMLAICFVCSRLCAAQSTPAPAAQQLAQAETQAQALYEKHAYADAAALLEKLASDPAIVASSEWPNALYSLACYQALAGRTSPALDTLNQAFFLGAMIPAEHLQKDPDLVSLHNEPAFKKLAANITSEQAVYKDNVALATDYKPVLTEDEKVAGLSKFWSEARFNFPFFGRLPGMDWDGLYMGYLPKVREAKTTADYYRVMMQFAAALKDSHTNVYPPAQLFANFYAAAGMRTVLIEGAVVVTLVLDPQLLSAGWKTGDIILKVNGRDVREYAESEVAPYVSSSSSQDGDVRLYNYFLLQGDVHQPLVLTVEDASGRQEMRKVSRLSSDAFMALWKSSKTDSAFKLLSGNVAYLAVNEFEDDSGLKTLLDHLPEIQSAKGLIVDVRQNGGGNSQNGISILQVLASKPFSWELERSPKYIAVYRAYNLSPGWEVMDQTMFQPDPQHHLGLPVSVLTSGATFSSAEDFVAIFEAMHRGVIIGEPTGGSTGQPFTFKLPGGGSARICTKETRTPDGNIYMGIGIQPQVVMRPSIADIRSGKDPIVEKAVEILSKRAAAQ